MIDGGEHGPADDDLAARLLPAFGLIGAGDQPIAFGAKTRQTFIDC